MDSRAKDFLDEYLATLSASERESVRSCSAEYFCADKEGADTCAALVRTGEKVATCSQKYWYESGEVPMPQVGHLQVVTNWEGEPTSILEITSVSERRFSDVDDDFAYSEGEGDKTLAEWRRIHTAFFEQECQEEGISFSEDTMLILERFKVVFPLEDHP